MTQTNIDQLTEEQLWDAVCLATRECPAFYSLEGFRHPNTCPGCVDKGPTPGRVWALPGMQEPPDSWSYGSRAKCDLGALLEHAKRLLAAFNTDGGAVLPIYVPPNTTVVVASLWAVAKVLVAQGAELGGSHES